MFDELHREKQQFRIKTVDIYQGELVKTVQYDSDTIKRYHEFNLHITSMFEQYACDVIKSYREILTQQDNVMHRNPIHYSAMNKFTNCKKTMEALLRIDFGSNLGTVPGYEQFLPMFAMVQQFEGVENIYDPRRSVHILESFKYLILPRDYD